jgi:DNA polymerase-3 subunit beta
MSSFTCSRADLVGALTFTKADPKSYMPILRAVKLSYAGGELTIETTDLFTASHAKIPAEGDQSVLAVDRKSLLTTLKAIASDRITFTQEGRSVAIKHGSGRSIVAAENAEDFPATATDVLAPLSPMNATDLSAYLAMVLPCSSTNETRASINSLLIETVDSAVVGLVATDGYRLARLALSSAAPNASYLISLDAAKQLAALVKGKGASEVCLSVGSTSFRAVRGDRSFTTRLVDAKFPPYEQLISAIRPVGASVFVPRADLANGCKSLRTTSKDTKRKTVTLKAGELRCFLESASGRLDLTAATFEGKEAEIGFNPDYMSDFLGSLPKAVDTVRLQLRGARDPIMCQVPLAAGAMLTALIMPVKA